MFDSCASARRPMHVDVNPWAGSRSRVVCTLVCSLLLSQQRSCVFLRHDAIKLPPDSPECGGRKSVWPFYESTGWLPCVPVPVLQRHLF